MKLPKLQVCSLNISKACGLKCPGCYAYKFFGNENAYMSLSNYKKIINKLGEEDGWQRVQLSGGEPFLHPDLVKMCRYTAKKMIKPIVFTSGIMTNNDMIAKLKPYVESFNVTIKYPNELDNRFKGHEKSLENSKKFLQICNDLNIPTQIHWAIDKGNYKYFDQIHGIAQQYNSMLFVLRFIPFDVKFKERFLIAKYWDAICKYALKHKNVHIGNTSKYTDYKCTAGLTRLSINTDSGYTPCIYLSNSLGNIFNDSLDEIKKKLYNWRLNYKYFDKCIAIETVIK